MSSQIYPSDTTWTELATGDCVITARGEVDITFAATLPPAGAAAHILVSSSDALEYTGPDKAWGRSRSPGSHVVVSDAAVQPASGPVAAVAPAVTAPPGVTPAAPQAGEDITVTLGTASGTPAPEASAELTVAGRRVALDNAPIRFPRAGAYELKVIWRNGVAPKVEVSVTGTVSDPAGAPAPGNTHAATVAGFSRDMAIFDSGAARGLDAATVPLSGTTDALDGAQIMAEIVRADTGAVVQAAVGVGTASGGSWAGALFGVPRNSNWLKVRVFVEGSTAAKAETANRFGVGHIVGLIGQSEDARMFADNFSQTAPLAVTDDSAVQVIRQQEGGAKPWPITIEAVTAASPVTASIAALADVLIRNAPGEKFLILDLAHSGTGRGNLANDSDFSRDWSDFAAIIAAARADGSDLGLILDSWTAADSAAADMFRLRYYPFYAGIDAAGADYVLGTSHQSRTYDHILWDLSSIGGRGIFDASKTALMMFGPHRFEVGQDMLDAVTQADGTPTISSTSRTPACRSATCWTTPPWPRSWRRAARVRRCCSTRTAIARSAPWTTRPTRPAPIGTTPRTRPRIPTTGFRPAPAMWR
ncbi:hypothetical protein AB0T83_11010 [Fluviibacterium sp. DFM31]|uniref:Uncharacterized protein n=1 Tax=Meridianimarinicoccus marinus TaxID=3231483 RepID=A0ABV3L6V5_9RHOB